jgi:AcrR family transcriptional regulator
MTTEKKSTHIRKGEIVKAAFEVLGRDGARGLTITAIANAAGMSEANIYRHFQGKDAIYSSLVDFIGSEVMGTAATIAAGSRGPREKLETIFFSHMALIEKHPGMPRIIFSEDIRLGNRKLGEQISMRLRSYVETLSGVIAAGIDEGDFRQGLSPRETALTFLGLIQSTALRWTVGGESFDFGDETRKLWNNFTRLVS